MLPIVDWKKQGLFTVRDGDWFLFDGNHALRMETLDVYAQVGKSYTMRVRVRATSDNPNDRMLLLGPNPGRDDISMMQWAGFGEAETVIDIPFRMANGLMLYIRDNQYRPYWLKNVELLGEAINPPPVNPPTPTPPAPGPTPPAPGPTPPAPTPPAPPPSGDPTADTFLLQQMFDRGDYQFDNRVYNVNRQLRISGHGALAHSPYLPARGNMPELDLYGPVIRSTVVGIPAILVKRPAGAANPYISNARLKGVRIEAPMASACLEVHNPASCRFEDLALIGPVTGAKLMVVYGGIQTVVDNVDFNGQGCPETVPHGDYSKHAEVGLHWGTGRNENNESGAPGTGNVVRNCYFHYNKIGAYIDATLVHFSEENIVEANTIGVVHGAGSRVKWTGGYFEANSQKLVELGRDSVTFMWGVDVGQTLNDQQVRPLPTLFDGDLYRLLVLSGCYVKGQGQVFKGGPTGYAVSFGSALPPNVGNTLLIEGPDGQGQGR